MHPGLKTTLAALAATAFAALNVCAIAAPHVQILSPTDEQIVQGPDVKVRFDVRGASLSPGSTNVHFMLDNEPFEVQYDAGHPHVFKDVAPGSHTIRAFITNKQHEAIRGSLDTVTFSVAYVDTANRTCAGAPLLTYNLPQGEYLGVDAADITLDYLVSNVNLSPEGNKVAYYVDGRRFFIEDGMPRHITGLRPGYHTVRIELQDQFGDTIEGPFNSVERTILVSPDQATNSEGVLASKYPAGLPRIASIHGAMTLGKPWRVVESNKPMTAEQVRQSQKLTVHRGTAGAATTGVTGTATGTESAGQGEIAVVNQGAPEVTTEESHTITEQHTDTTQVPAEQPLQSSSRKLDDRLERRGAGSQTSMLHADAPTSTGAVTVRRINRATAGTSSTASSASSTATSVLRVPGSSTPRPRADANHTSTTASAASPTAPTPNAPATPTSTPTPAPTTAVTPSPTVTLAITPAITPAASTPVPAATHSAAPMTPAASTPVPATTPAATPVSGSTQTSGTAAGTHG